MFDPAGKVQIPMDTICERFLNLKFHKRKNQPNAFSEAKIIMALFQKWLELYGQKPKGQLTKPSAIVPNIHSLQDRQPKESLPQKVALEVKIAENRIFEAAAANFEKENEMVEMSGDEL